MERQVTRIFKTGAFVFFVFWSIVTFGQVTFHTDVAFGTVRASESQTDLYSLHNVNPFRSAVLRFEPRPWFVFTGHYLLTAQIKLFFKFIFYWRMIALQQTKLLIITKETNEIQFREN